MKLLNFMLKSLVTGRLHGIGTAYLMECLCICQYRTYSIRGGYKGKPLPVVLCDTMGLEEGANAGLDIDDFTSILKGNVQDRYQVTLVCCMV